jgi:hypothetical protein
MEITNQGVIDITHKATNAFVTQNGILHNADCFDIMKTLPDKSVNMILSDLPYG